GLNVRPVMVDAPKNAVPVGTVAGFQLAAVLKSELPGAVDQVAFWAFAGMAASKAAAPVVANKYARIPLPPPSGDSLNADRLVLQDCRSSTRGAMLLESASADLLRPVALRPRVRDQFRPRR